ncbi:unnamed protein product [Urochloa humidicola]
MELPPLLLVTILAMVLATVILRNSNQRCSPAVSTTFPRGREPWPVIDNFNLIGALPLPHRSIHELSKKYGELVHLRFGSSSVIVVSSAAGKYTIYGYADIT